VSVFLSYTEGPAHIPTWLLASSARTYGELCEEQINGSVSRRVVRMRVFDKKTDHDSDDDDDGDGDGGGDGEDDEGDNDDDGGGDDDEDDDR